MRLQTALAIILPLFTCCQAPVVNTNPYHTIGEIPIPKGFHRVTSANGSFAAWLRQLPLKADKTVYLYNGSLKSNQASQFAVVDIPVGNKDLQQCADAVMRLRAEYLYSCHRYTEIDFTDNNFTHYTFSAAGRDAFDKYLEKVFSWCGTLSLSQQLKAVPFGAMAAGDVLIQGGSPGHAMLVADMAADNEGHIVYLLAQSYMPAQDIHIVINPGNHMLSPWYGLDSSFPIATPDWTFKTSQLKTWPGRLQ
jgi:hypothetical protein